LIKENNGFIYTELKGLYVVSKRVAADGWTDSLLPNLDVLDMLSQQEGGTS
jgi:hypothetical protein